jgi:hypothetical protein
MKRAASSSSSSGRWSGGATETKACGGSALGVSTATVSGVKKVVARVFPDRLLRGTENIRVVGYVCWMGNSPSRTRSLLSGSLSAGWGMGRLKTIFRPNHTRDAGSVNHKIYFFYYGHALIARFACETLT